MRAWFAIFQREVAAYCFSPVLYVLATSFMVMTGYFFFVIMQMGNGRVISYGETVQIMISLTFFIAPFMTMRLLAEEKAKGTIETLMTAPIGEAQIVLAKFFASIAIFILMLVPTISFVVLMSQYGSIDPGEVVGCYLAIILMASALFAIGIFVSALCSNQISAGVITLMIAIFILAINWLSNSIAITGEGSADDKIKEFLKNALEYISFVKRTDNTMKGILETRDIAFFLSVDILFLFMTVRAVGSRRWR